MRNVVGSILTGTLIAWSLGASAFALQFDSDVPTDIQAQMAADLDFIGGLQGAAATPLHHQIFGNVDGAGYRSWFETRVTHVGLSGCGDSGAVACVMPIPFAQYFGGTHKMSISQNYIQFSHPAIARLMVVYHEARHTEDAQHNWPHADCPSPFVDANGNDMKSIWTGLPLAREPACDTTPLGSYGSSTILLKNISKNCTNCTDKVKADAELYSDDQLGRMLGPAKDAIRRDAF